MTKTRQLLRVGLITLASVAVLIISYVILSQYLFDIQVVTLSAEMLRAIFLVAIVVVCCRGLLNVFSVMAPEIVRIFTFCGTGVSFVFVAFLVLWNATYYRYYQDQVGWHINKSSGGYLVHSAKYTRGYDGQNYWMLRAALDIVMEDKTLYITADYPFGGLLNDSDGTLGSEIKQAEQKADSVTLSSYTAFLCREVIVTDNNYLCDAAMFSLLTRNADNIIKYINYYNQVVYWFYMDDLAEDDGILAVIYNNNTIYISVNRYSELYEQIHGKPFVLPLVEEEDKMR